jgi:death on curing protein
MSGEVKMLSVEEVLKIHDLLVMDFATTKDPISPPGTRSLDLLESAVGRQHTGLGNVLKYPDPIHNAATLLYGICLDHPFYNGNKRTALVSMLAHLEKNRMALYATNQQELYDFMLAIAAHEIVGRGDKRTRRNSPRHDPDAEVAQIAAWLEARADEVSRGERIITYRQLRGILAKFHLYMENPKGNSIDICRYVVRRKLFSSKEVTEKKRIGNIGYPGEGHEIAIKQIKKIREMCELTEADGVDSDSFYSNAAMLDYFVSRYRKVLTWLAKT